MEKFVRASDRLFMHKEMINNKLVNSNEAD